MAIFNSNVWYQITESRVDLNSSLQSNGATVFFAKAAREALQYWQLLPIQHGNFQIRNRAQGLHKQLSTCYVAEETDASRTRPCMMPATGDNAQKWTIDAWGDGTYKMINVANGTGYHMDCHPGNPLFMSSNINDSPPQPAQHWMFSSVGVIDDGGYSTTITSQATSTASSTVTGSASPTSSDLPNSPTTTPVPTSAPSRTAEPGTSIKAGTAAGLGVGVGMAVILLAALLALFFRRRRRRQAGHTMSGWDMTKVEGSKTPERKAQHVQAHEMEVPPHELESERPPRELMGKSSP